MTITNRSREDLTAAAQTRPAPPAASITLDLTFTHAVCGTRRYERAQATLERSDADAFRRSRKREAIARLSKR